MKEDVLGSLYDKFGIEVEEGEFVFVERQSSDCAYIIYEGKARILKFMKNAQKVLAVLGKGAIVGEMGVITNAPRSASMQALTPLKLIKLSRENLFYIVDKCPDFAWELAVILAKRLANADKEILEYRFHDIRFRALRYLLALVNRRTEEFTLLDLEDNLGISAEETKKLIAFLEKNKLIERREDEDVYFIKDPQKIKDLRILLGKQEK